jgi:hypothetical protein
LAKARSFEPTSSSIDCRLSSRWPELSAEADSLSKGRSASEA